MPGLIGKKHWNHGLCISWEPRGEEVVHAAVEFPGIHKDGVCGTFLCAFKFKTELFASLVMSFLCLMNVDVLWRKAWRNLNWVFLSSLIFQVYPNCQNNVLGDCINPVQRPFEASPLFSDEEDFFWRSGTCSRILKHTKSAVPTDPAFWAIFYKQIRAFMNFNLPGSHLSSEQCQDIKLDIRRRWMIKDAINY